MAGTALDQGDGQRTTTDGVDEIAKEFSEKLNIAGYKFFCSIDTLAF